MIQSSKGETASTTGRRLISNTVWNMTGLVSHALVGFLLIGFFLRHLGDTRYGVWILIGSVFRYRGILSMGLNNAVNRYVPLYLAQKDDAALQRVISTALGFYGLVGVLLIGVTFLLRHFLGDWFTIESHLLPQAQSLVLITGLGFAVIMPLQLATAVLAGCQRYDWINATSLTCLILRTVLLIGLLERGYGLLLVGWLYAASEIITRVLQWLYLALHERRFRLSFHGMDWRLLREMLGYGSHTFLYVVGGLAAIKVCDLVIGVSSLGMSGVTQFSLAAAAVLLLTQLMQAFTQAIMPAASDLSSREQGDTIREMAFLAQKYSLILLLPAVGFCVIMGRAFLTIWVGDKINDPATLAAMSQVLVLLAIGHGLRLAYHSQFQILVGRGGHRPFGYLMVGMTVSVVVLSVLFLWPLNLGLVGVGWANLLPMILVAGIILPTYVARQFHMRRAEIIERIVRPVFYATTPALMLLVGWRFWAEPQTWPEILAVVAAVGGLTLAGAWCWGLTHGERDRFARLLRPA